LICSVGFAALEVDFRTSLEGRLLPTADVGYPVAQLGGQLSGGEIARTTGAGRPVPAVRLGAAYGCNAALPVLDLYSVRA